jgi:endo-1,4-beta-xylanase
MCGRASQGSAFVRQLDDAIRANQAHPVIAVLVNGMSDSWYFDSFDGKWPIESVIIRDLVPHIDRTYRTIASREARGVEGFSMGGFGAAHLAFKFPEVFGVATLDAAAFNSLAEFRQGIPEISAKIFGADSTYFARNEPRALLEQNAARIRDRMTIRIAVGDLDRLQQANQGFHELLNRLRIDHEFEVVPGVDHNRQLFYDRLKDRAFRHYDRAFAPCVSDTGRICK